MTASFVVRLPPTGLALAVQLATTWLFQRIAPHRFRARAAAPELAIPAG